MLGDVLGLAEEESDDDSLTAGDPVGFVPLAIALLARIILMLNDFILDFFLYYFNTCIRMLKNANSKITIVVSVDSLFR